MPAESDKNIRIPVPGEEGKHSGHSIRTIVVSSDKGIKALYCVTCKKIITYIFAKSKDWTMAKAKEWVSEHTKKTKSLKEISVDQSEEFLKVIATMDDESTEEYPPSPTSGLFTLEKDIEEATMGYDKEELEDAEKREKEPAKISGKLGGIQSSVSAGPDKEYLGGIVMDFICKSCGKEFEAEGTCPDCNTVLEKKARGQGQGQGGARQGDGGADKCVCPKCGTEVSHEKGKPCNDKKCPECGTAMIGKSNKSTEDSSDESVEVIKVDKQKQMLYGIFLVPEKPDWDGDVISAEDIEKVAHMFVVDYRTIDVMHKKVVAAEIVESSIAWKNDLDFYGKKLAKGTWFGAIKVHDKEVWDKVLAGDYKAFSVRISGVREPIKKEAVNG